MPLVWAHAEHTKLCLSHAQGLPVDRPEQTWLRYQSRRPTTSYYVWSLKQRLHIVPVGKTLRLLLSVPATVHWGVNSWQNIADSEAQDWGLGYIASLPADALNTGETIEFTFYHPDTGLWQREDFQVRIVARGDDL